MAYLPHRIIVYLSDACQSFFSIFLDSILRFKSSWISSAPWPFEIKVLKQFYVPGNTYFSWFIFPSAWWGGRNRLPKFYLFFFWTSPLSVIFLPLSWFTHHPRVGYYRRCICFWSVCISSSLSCRLFSAMPYPFFPVAWEKFFLPCIFSNFFFLVFWVFYCCLVHFFVIF